MADWFEYWFASEQYLNVYKHRDESDAVKLLKLISKNIFITKEELILDAACGSGRYTNLLLRNGYKVIGFDLSLPLLKRAKNDSREFTSDSVYFRADLRNVGLKKAFKLILNVFTSFGYFYTDEENFRFMRNSKNFLKSKGYFVFDYMNADYLNHNLIPETVKKIDDYLIREKRRIEKNRVIKEIVIEQGGRTNYFIENVGLYSNEIIEEVFFQMGYKIVKKFGNYNGESFDKELSPRLILILQNEN